MNRPGVLIIVALAMAIAGCADDGRELRAPQEGATVPDAAPPAVDAGTESEASRTDFVFAAEAFEDGGPIPAENTCDGADVSPALTWDGVPFGTGELAVVVTDPDVASDVEDGIFTHWVLTGISPQSTGLAAGEVPAGAVEALSSLGFPGWSGPCPPAEHHYQFRLYVLVEPLGMTPGLPAGDAVALVQNAAIQSIGFTGTYGPAES